LVGEGEGRDGQDRPSWAGGPKGGTCECGRAFWWPTPVVGRPPASRANGRLGGRSSSGRALIVCPCFAGIVPRWRSAVGSSPNACELEPDRLPGSSRSTTCGQAGLNTSLRVRLRKAVQWQAGKCTSRPNTAKNLNDSSRRPANAPRRPSSRIAHVRTARRVSRIIPELQHSKKWRSVPAAALGPLRNPLYRSSAPGRLWAKCYRRPRDPGALRTRRPR